MEQSNSLLPGTCLFAPPRRLLCAVGGMLNGGLGLQWLRLNAWVSDCSILTRPMSSFDTPLSHQCPQKTSVQRLLLR